MKFKEFKNAVEDLGRKYHCETVIEADTDYIEIRFVGEYYPDTICEIHKSKRFVLDLNWNLFIYLSENARNDLFEIVTEFAKTPPADREDEKSFIIPLPGLITSDGEQQYLTYKDDNFFASRRNEDLRQIWKEEHLKHVPEVYRQFAVEFNKGEEC